MRVLIDADSILFKAACVNKRKGTEDSFKDSNFEVRKRIDEAVQKIKSDCFADDVLLAVKGRNNFRYGVYDKYKGNRKKALGDNLRARLNFAHEHAVTYWDAVQSDGMEADDLVSIWAYEMMADDDDQWIVAHIDKDLDQIPGRHYNYSSGEIYNVDRDTAAYNFNLQLLMGDRGDGIPNVKRGMGRRTAEQHLAGKDIQRQLETIANLYRAHHPDWLARLNMIGNLLWLKRSFTTDLEYDYEDQLKSQTDEREQDECLPSSSDEGREEVRAELSDS